QQDPNKGSSAAPLSASYVYVKDRPTVADDPSGLCLLWHGSCPGGSLAQWFGHRIDCAIHPFCGPDPESVPDSNGLPGAIAAGLHEQLSEVLLNRGFQGCLRTAAQSPSWVYGPLNGSL